MQQERDFSCQKLSGLIRNAVRRKAEELKCLRDGTIKVSYMPLTEEADKYLGGLSLSENDVPLYEYSFALNHYIGFNSHESSDYMNYTICVCPKSDDVKKPGYEFLSITVRIHGAGDNNKALAKAAKDGIVEFLMEYPNEYTVI